MSAYGSIDPLRLKRPSDVHVLELEQARAPRSRAATTRAILESSPAADVTCRPSRTGSSPSAATIFVARRVQLAGGQVVADQVDRGDERLGLDRQQPGGAVERVRVRLGVDLDLAAGQDLGVEHVGAAAEVDDVEDVEVLAQLLLGHLQRVAAPRARAGARPPRPARIRTEASVTRRAKRSGRMAASARERLRGSGSPSATSVGFRARRTAAASTVSGLAGVALDDAVQPRARLLDELGRAEDAGVLAERERPADQQPRQRVVRAVDGAAVVALRDLAVGGEVALHLPGDQVGDPDLGGADRLAELPRDAVDVLARVEVVRAREVVLGLGGVGDLALDAVQPELALGAAVVVVADEVELPALEGQVVRVHACAARSRRGPSSSTRTRSACGGRSRCRSSRSAGEMSCPPAAAVMPRPTVRWCGRSSGLGRPQVICCSASRSGSA